MNVLLTCAGRRNYLLGYFRAALAGRGSVLAADANPNAPAMLEADEAFIVPRLTDPGYVERLLTICAAHRVRVLVPLNDVELPLIARNRDRFAAQGTVVVVSAPNIVGICADKWLTARFLESQGLRGPRTFPAVDDAAAALDRGEVATPLVVKPRWGSASIGITVVERSKDLVSAALRVRREVQRTALQALTDSDPDGSVIVQELLAGQEYGLDVVNDLSGRHVATFARRKLAMRAGETDVAVTVDDPELLAVGARLGRALGHVGNLDCDVFQTSRGPVLLELNPRFGGGYPFSQTAGADLPAALLAWVQGLAADPAWLRIRPGVLAAKCDRLVTAPPRPAAAARAMTARAEPDPVQL